MRINAVAIVTITFILLYGSGLSQSVNLDSGLVAFYPFNGNADNAAGSSGNGQLVGNVSFVKDRFGQATSAVRFSSDGSYIVFQEADVDLPMGNAPRSFSVWLKSDNVETVDYLLCYGTEQTAQMCHIDIVHDRPRFQFGYCGFSLMGQSLITDNHWHHIVCVFDGLYARIYVDCRWDNECIPGETIEQVNTVSNETGIWTMAIQQTLLWSTYIGSMDDIRIYNRALSEAEILNLYDCPTRTINQKIPENFPQLTQSRDADFQKILDDEVRINNVLGLAAAVITPDWQWQGASGLSSSGSPNGLSIQSKMTVEKLFRIGRPIDTYISALVLELAEEGKLSVDDSLHQWLPSYPNIDSTITIRQLLNHTSGLSGWNDVVEEQFWINPTRIFTPEELLYDVDEPYCLPSESNVPCVTNYFLLGLIIKEIIQHDLSTELRNRYLDPLNLKNTYLAIEEQVPNNLAHEHNEVESWRFFDYTSYVKSANAINSSLWVSGAMYSTAMDLAQWVYALLSGEVVSQNALEQMLTFDPFPYDGLGVLRHLQFKRVFIENGGPIDVGYRSDFIFSQQDQICINIFSNYWPGDLGPCRNKLLYATLVYKNQLPAPRFEPMEIDLGTVVSGFPVIDTSFTIYNDGVVADHISLSIDYGNLDSGALTVEPLSFDLDAGMSQQVSISIDPSPMNDTTCYRPKILIHSDNDLILPAALTERIYFSNNMPSRITTEKMDCLPGQYILYQNYPNPFNHITMIRYQLPEACDVKLSIYNLLGQEIAILINENKTAGSHEIKWSAEGLPSGVYFCRLQGSNFTETKKFVLLK
jgi:CubicO group peptidase (beta-lactamase class C family)